MRAILVNKGIWAVVDPSSGKITALDSARVAQGESLELWREQDGKASTAILMNIENHLVEEVAGIDSAAQLWTYFLAKYESNFWLTRMSVFIQWADLRFEGKDLEKFCNRYMNVLGQFDSLDIAFSKELRVYGFISRVARYFPTRLRSYAISYVISRIPSWMPSYRLMRASWGRYWRRVKLNYELLSIVARLT